MSHPLTLLYATTTGNAEDCALRAARQLESLGHRPRLVNMRDATPADLASGGTLLLVVSTWGDGEPPDDAIPFWEKAAQLPTGCLAGTRYAVLALGDSGYEKFCGFGRDCDALLERLQALRIHPRVECDVDDEEEVDAWIGRIADSLAPAISS